MAESLGSAVLDLTADKSAMSSVLRSAETEAEGTFRSMGAKAQSAGAKLSMTLTPVALALGLAFKKSFEEFDAGADSLRVQTGKVGDELDGLVDSMKRVGGQVTQPLSEVGKVMGDLARRTGLVGPPLEALTKQILDLSRITGTDAATNVKNLTRLFGDWSIAGEDQAATLDKLFRASQAAGIGVDDLSRLMTDFGSPLRNLGLDFDTSAAMFAKFEKEGVNIQTMMPGLKMALKNFAADGREPAEALKETIQEMKNAGSESELMTIAFETFGARAGPDMAAAVREGRFSFEELIGAMNNGKDTIATATEDTNDLTDKMAMLRNKVVGIIGPFGEMGSVIMGAVAAIGPALFGFGTIAQTSFGKVIGGWTKTAASFVAGNALMIGALAVGVFAVLNFARSFENARKEAQALMDELDTAEGIDGFQQRVNDLAAASEHMSTKFSDAFMAIATGADTATQTWNALRDEIAANRAELEGMTGATADILRAQTNLAAATLNAADITARLGREMAIASGAVDAQEAAEIALEDALKMSATAADEAAFAEMELADIRRTLSGVTDDVTTAEIAVRDAQRRHTDALAALNDLEDEGVTKGRKYKEVQDRVTESEIAVREAKRRHAEATKDLTTKIEAATQSGVTSQKAFDKLTEALGLSKKEVNKLTGDIPGMVAKLDDMVAKGKLTEDQARAVAVAVAGLSTKIKNVPKSHHTVFTADESLVISAVNNILAAFDNLPGSVGGIFNVTGRAQGGLVTKDLPYVVGERGPELFIPGASGSIVPNSRLEGLTPGAVDNSIHIDGLTIEGDSPEAKQLHDLLSRLGQAARQGVSS